VQNGGGAGVWFAALLGVLRALENSLRSIVCVTAGREWLDFGVFFSGGDSRQVMRSFAASLGSLRSSENSPVGSIVHVTAGRERRERFMFRRGVDERGGR